MKIIFGLSRSKSRFAFFSQAIMEVEKRPFSHVFVKMEDPISGVPIVFHAAKGIVHFMSLKTFESKNQTVKLYEVIFDDNKFKNLWQYMMEHSGTDYSMSQLFSIFLNKIFKSKIGLDQNKDKEMICSELALLILDNLGLGGYKKSQDEITPSEFHAWIETLCDWYPDKVREMEM